MAKADHTAAIRARGKQHTFVSVTPGTINASTNLVTGGSETNVSAHGVFQHSREQAVGGVAVVQGDEILLLEAQPLQDASKVPKVGDAVLYAGSSSYRRPVVGWDPVHGNDGTVWFYRLLLRGSIDRE